MDFEMQDVGYENRNGQSVLSVSNCQCFFKCIRDLIERSVLVGGCRCIILLLDSYHNKSAWEIGAKMPQDSNNVA